MYKKNLAASLILALVVTPVAAYDCNIDIKNTGSQVAWDVAVVLEGIENITQTYDGYSTGRFQTITKNTSGPNTLLHWEHPIGSIAGNGISTNEIIHVGWSTADQNSHVVDLYWTGQDGKRLLGSNIQITRADIIGNRVTFSHAFASVGVDLRHIRYSIRPNRWDLPLLNPSNATLMASLRPLEDFIHLEPGDVVNLTLPEIVPAGSFITLVYEADSPESDGAATVFEQARG
jgi:hypothetical protein